MQILVIGSTGQLGCELMGQYPDAIGISSKDFDFKQTTKIQSYLNELGQFDCIINAMAMNDTALAEKEVGDAFKLNAYALKEISLYATVTNARLFHISTDYVFNGSTGNYKEEDLPSPLNSYGLSKLTGEYFVKAYAKDYCILRLASLYGVKSVHGNFLEKIYSKFKAGDSLKIVDDQYMSPTNTLDSINTIKALLSLDKLPSILHCSGQGKCSWHEFASTFFSHLGEEILIEKCSWQDFPSALQRPIDSSFNTTKLKQYLTMPTWQDSLKNYVEKRHLK